MTSSTLLWEEEHTHHQGTTQALCQGGLMSGWEVSEWDCEGGRFQGGNIRVGMSGRECEGGKFQDGNTYMQRV